MMLREELKPLSTDALKRLLADAKLVQSMRKADTASRIFWRTFQSKIQDEINKRHREEIEAWEDTTI